MLGNHMKISGFSFGRNLVKLYYPIEEAVRSILPICDEFIIAVGRGDDDDTTREIVEKIGDPKIKIIDTEWKDREKLKGLIHGQQTNIALKECSGDWCFYIQSDEVVHEDDLPKIKARCEELLDDKRVEGLLFDYLHFWGDYDHYHTGHAWYRREIRIIRNHMGIKSWSSAQSFRLDDDQKLQVAKVDARIFHYGWARPPHLMQKKNKAMNTTHHGRDGAEEEFRHAHDEFDYGPLNRLDIFKDTHPAVMKKRIAEMDWKHKLRESDPPGMKREPHKDETLKYRVISGIEKMTGLSFKNKNWRKILKV